MRSDLTVTKDRGVGRRAIERVLENLNFQLQDINKDQEIMHSMIIVNTAI